MTVVRSYQVESRQDLDSLTELLAGLVGEPCWDAYVANGEELQLDIGDRVPYESKRRPDAALGSWVLGVRHEDWYVDGRSAATRTGSPPFFLGAELDWMLPALKSVVAGFEVRLENLALVLDFANGHVLEVRPGDLAEDDPYWNLSIPGDMHVQAGPGRVWHHGPSDSVWPALT